MIQRLASLLIALLSLGGCQQFMPIPTDGMPDQPSSARGQGAFYGGVCHYENGDEAIPGGGSSVCP